MANFKMAILGTLGAAAALSAVTTAPALAQAVISEPGYCAFFYPNANCQNKGPGNPYTDPNYQRGQNAAAWQGDQTVGVAPRRRARKPHCRYQRLQRIIERRELELSLPPIPFTLEMITSEIPAAISPYSIAVAPDSSARNFFSIFIAVASPSRGA